MYSTKGVEKELAIFLDNKDLSVRSNSLLSQTFKTIALGSKNTLELLKQHGCTSEHGALSANIDKKLGMKLLAASESVDGIDLVCEDAEISKILVHIPVCFSFSKK